MDSLRESLRPQAEARRQARSAVARRMSPCYHSFVSTWSYEEILAACAAGGYPSCEIRAASGRLNLLLGLTRGDLDWLEQAARARQTGLALVGSRVSGPRSRQRSLHPALWAALPLRSSRREASTLDPGAEGVEIDKTRIKDLGRADPRTSDLTIALIDARTGAERAALAVDLENTLNSRGWGFPARVFAVWDGAVLRDEEDFRAAGERYLRGLAPKAEFSSAQWRAALAEMYLGVNLP